MDFPYMRSDQFLRVYLAEKCAHDQAEILAGDLQPVRGDGPVPSTAVPVISVAEMWDDIRRIQQQFDGRFYSHEGAVREDLAYLESHRMAQGYYDADENLYAGISGWGCLGPVLRPRDEYSPLYDAINSVLEPDAQE